MPFDFPQILLGQKSSKDSDKQEMNARIRQLEEDLQKQNELNKNIMKKMHQMEFALL